MRRRRVSTSHESLQPRCHRYREAEPEDRASISLADLWISVEMHAHPVLCTPNDGAGQMQGIVGDNQREFPRDTGRIGELEQGSRGRKVANSAIDRDAAEFNLGGLQDAVANCNASFNHQVEIRQKLKEPIKNSFAISGSPKIWM